ncbi:unnamed protein product, partial [Prorocentrum cordatum]
FDDHQTFDTCTHSPGGDHQITQCFSEKKGLLFEALLSEDVVRAEIAKSAARRRELMRQMAQDLHSLPVDDNAVDAFESRVGEKLPFGGFAIVAHAKVFHSGADNRRDGLAQASEVKPGAYRLVEYETTQQALYLKARCGKYCDKEAFALSVRRLQAVHADEDLGYLRHLMLLRPPPALIFESKTPQPRAAPPLGDAFGSETALHWEVLNNCDLDSLRAAALGVALPCNGFAIEVRRRDLIHSPAEGVGARRCDPMGGAEGASEGACTRLNWALSALGEQVPTDMAGHFRALEHGNAWLAERGVRVLPQPRGPNSPGRYVKWEPLPRKTRQKQRVGHFVAVVVHRDGVTVTDRKSGRYASQEYCSADDIPGVQRHMWFLLQDVAPDAGALAECVPDLQREIDADDLTESILERWGPADFQRILRRRGDFIFAHEVEGEPDNMLSVVAKVRAKAAELIAQRPTLPDEGEKGALNVIALHMRWKTACGVQRGTGVRRLELALLKAAAMFADIMGNCVTKDVTAVFDVMLAQPRRASTLAPITSIDTKEFRSAKPVGFSAWAMGAFKNMSVVAIRFVGGSSYGSPVEMVGIWKQEERPEQPSTVVVFEDACVKIRPEKPENSAERMQNVAKSIEHKSCFFIPCSIVLELSLEALAFMNQVMPPVLFLEYADGGSSKSARTLLRDNVWRGHHEVVSPRCFQEPDESRRQGGQFAPAEILTIQECAPGGPMVEDVMKSFISGDRLMCRPLFGTITAYYRWNRAARFWEVNWGFPSMSGSPDDVRKLCAFERRIRVVKLLATFTSDPAKVDVENRIFKEDTELGELLESPFARQAYLDTNLIPWILEHSASECSAVVMTPPPENLNESRLIVAAMASGGLHVPESFRAPEEGAAATESAEKIFRDVHAKQAANSIIKTHAIEQAGGAAVFGGGFAPWRSARECREFHRDRPEGGDAEDASEIAVRNQCGSLMGTCNYQRLSEKVDSGEIADAGYAKMPMQRSVRCGGGMAQIEVPCCRKFGIPGCRLAQRPSLQWMVRDDRAVALSLEPSISFQGGKESWETKTADINNCFVALIVKEIEQVCQMKEELPALAAFAANCKAWRSALAAYMSASARVAKKPLVKSVHLGKPDCDLPFLWNLSVGMHTAVDLLLAQDKFTCMEGRFENRRCPPASKLHYALSSIEDMVLADLDAEAASIHGVSVNACMFDGAMFLTPEDAVADLRAAANAVAAKCGLRITVEVIGDGHA